MTDSLIKGIKRNVAICGKCNNFAQSQLYVDFLRIKGDGVVCTSPCCSKEIACSSADYEKLDIPSDCLYKTEYSIIGWNEETEPEHVDKGNIEKER